MTTKQYQACLAIQLSRGFADASWSGPKLSRHSSSFHSPTFLNIAGEPACLFRRGSQ
jgi:hypothetical protein